MSNVKLTLEQAIERIFRFMVASYKPEPRQKFLWEQHKNVRIADRIALTSYWEGFRDGERYGFNGDGSRRSGDGSQKENQQ